jgi:hypothetical protein
VYCLFIYLCCLFLIATVGRQRLQESPGARRARLLEADSGRARQVTLDHIDPMCSLSLSSIDVGLHALGFKPQHSRPSCSRARQNTHEMEPKNRPTKERPAKGPSQAAGDQDITNTEATILTTHIPQTNHPHTSTESHVTAIDVRRPEGPVGHPST